MARSARLLIATAITAVSLAAPIAKAAQAVSPCVAGHALAEKLGKDFGETVTAQGVDDAGNLLQVFTSESGSWTIAVTLPGGPTCVVSSGESWSDPQFAQVRKPIPRPDRAS